MPTQRFSKFPDFVEITSDEEGDVKEVTFVVIRKNSRAFQTDQLQTLHALEHIARVVVRVGTQDLTLEQFEQQGAYDNSIAPKLIAQSTYYNRRAELKRHELLLRSLSLDDPGRELVWARVQRLRVSLGLGEEGAEIDAKLEKDTKDFTSLQEMLHQAEIKPGPEAWNDEKLSNITWRKLAESVPEHVNGVRNQLHFDLFARKSVIEKAKLQNGDNTNAERKPDVAGEDSTTNKDGEGSSTTIISVDRLESD